MSVLFRDFANFIMEHYDLRFGVPVWSEANGWTYRIGRSGVYLLKGIQIKKTGFIVDDITVCDRAGYASLLEYVKDIYEQKECEFLKKITEKNTRQAQRNERRVNREREEFLAIKDRVVPEKYNVFHWPPKLDIQKLKKLYISDARGIQDMVLADEVGLALYLRCKCAKEDGERMEKYRIRCHHCGKELAGESDFRQCSCGYQYSFREYRRSYSGNNMPAGAASAIFDAFMEKWNLAKSYSDKMILIDTLLHEFHRSLISGTVHRPVAMNFIDGSRKRVESLIVELGISKDCIDS